MEKEKTKVTGNLLGFRGVRIEKRLKKAFNFVSIIAAIASLVGLIALVVVTENFKEAMNNYALPQGDIALFMNEYAECRSNTRGIIGYEDQDMIDSLVQKYENRKEKTYERLAEIDKTTETSEGRTVYNAIQQKLEEYFAIEAEIIKLGATTDQDLCRQAQEMAINDLAPVYTELDELTLELMDLNIQHEERMNTFCTILEYAAMIIIVILTIIILAVSKTISIMIARGIAEPLGKLKERLQTFEQGDISSPFPEYKEEDEVGEIVQAVLSTATKLQTIFGDLEYLLNKMANGNFNLRTSCEDEYIGEYEGLLEAIRQMNRKMDSALKEVREASEMVSSGSMNLADGSQALAEGATEQAASIEEIQATMDELTAGLEKCAKDVGNAYDKAEGCALSAEVSQSEMQSMVAIMERISNTSSEIESIIGEIEDIASQTNLLSLNAAIEAARAGDAGRGFAVVADQIRNLAEQSAKSAVNTRKLIEGSVSEINAGSKAVLKTAEVLEEVVSSVKDIAGISRELSENVKEQVESIEQANGGIYRISEVIQSNSATAQEASATSEELSAQATSMDELVGRFELRE